MNFYQKKNKKLKLNKRRRIRRNVLRYRNWQEKEE